MNVSYIINTAALDPWVSNRKNPWRTYGYNQRLQLLEAEVLPAALEQGFREVIVAGCFKGGTQYHYVEVLPAWRDRRDALYQRELGARYATGDILIFGHDDHKLARDFSLVLDDYMQRDDWDLLVPRRLHGITGATLNNGAEHGYMGGHVLVMKRWLWARVPWTTINTEYWDTHMTRIWQDAGGKLLWCDDLCHIDVEAAEDES